MIRQVISGLLSVLLLTGVPPVNAQDGADDNGCAEPGACRVVAPLRVESPEGDVTTVEMGMELPWVTQGNVLLAPGDAVLVALDEVDGLLIPRLLAAGQTARMAQPGEGQLRFEFGLIERGMLTLSVISRFADPVEYGALKVSLADGPNRTSVCTLMPGLPVIETWEEPIYHLALWGFRRAEGMACREIDFGGDRLQQNDNGPAA